MMRHSFGVTSSVVFVSVLERSVEFYRDVFACSVSIQDHDAALLIAPGGFQLYLIARGSRTQHYSGSIGLQYLIWSTDTADDLEHLERLLKNRGAHTDIHTSNGVRFLGTRDPDGIRVVTAHPSPTEFPRSFLDPRLYS
jgi:catechol 2,3-dioxygenase-like lactoylglutathione lyase family enzyme